MQFGSCIRTNFRARSGPLLLLSLQVDWHTASQICSTERESRCSVLSKFSSGAPALYDASVHAISRYPRLVQLTCNDGILPRMSFLSSWQLQPLLLHGPVHGRAAVLRNATRICWTPWIGPGKNAHFGPELMQGHERGCAAAERAACAGNDLAQAKVSPLASLTSSLCVSRPKPVRKQLCVLWVTSHTDMLQCNTSLR